MICEFGTARGGGPGVSGTRPPDRPLAEDRLRHARSEAKADSECGKAAANLWPQGCVRVAIVWDLYPAWREREYRPCRREDRLAIHESLTAAGVDPDRIGLVCIREELEAWLIADGGGFGGALHACSSRAGKARAQSRVDPKPEEAIGQLFQRISAGNYL